MGVCFCKFSKLLSYRVGTGRKKSSADCGKQSCSVALYQPQQGGEWYFSGTGDRRGHIGDGERGVIVGFNEQPVVGYHTGCFGIETRAEREHYATVEQLTRDVRFPTESMQNPSLSRIRFAMNVENDVVSPHAMDYHRFAQSFADRYVLPENIFLPWDRGAFKAVDSAFADGHNARIAAQFFEEGEIMARGHGVPWMYAHGIDVGVSGEFCKWFSRNDSSKPERMRVYVGYRNGHVGFTAQGRIRFLPRDDSAGCGVGRGRNRGICRAALWLRQHTGCMSARTGSSAAASERCKADRIEWGG